MVNEEQVAKTLLRCAHAGAPLSFLSELTVTLTVDSTGRAHAPNCKQRQHDPLQRTFTVAELVTASAPSRLRGCRCCHPSDAIVGDPKAQLRRLTGPVRWLSAAEAALSRGHLVQALSCRLRLHLQQLTGPVLNLPTSDQVWLDGYAAAIDRRLRRACARLGGADYPADLARLARTATAVDRVVAPYAAGRREKRAGLDDTSAAAVVVVATNAAAGQRAISMSELTGAAGRFVYDAGPHRRLFTALAAELAVQPAVCSPSREPARLAAFVLQPAPNATCPDLPGLALATLLLGAPDPGQPTVTLGARVRTRRPGLVVADGTLVRAAAELAGGSHHACVVDLGVTWPTDTADVLRTALRLWELDRPDAIGNPTAALAAARAIHS